jgi:twinkle protein
VQIENVASFLNSHAQQVTSYLYPDAGDREGDELRLGDVNGEKGRSMKVNLTKGIFYDHATGQTGDMLDLWCERNQCNKKTAAEDANNVFSIERAVPKPTLNKGDMMPAVDCSMATGYLQGRGISKEVMSRYRLGSTGTAMVFPRFSPDAPRSPKAVGIKYWTPPKQISQAAGSANTCFGWQACEGGRPLVITEGEIDALSVAQMCPALDAVSVPAGATNLKWMEHDQEKLNQYDDIILWMDSDEAGQQKIDAIVHQLGRDRVRVVDPRSVQGMGCKDANDLIQSNQGENIISLIDSAAYRTRMVSACSGMSLSELADEALFGKRPLHFMGEINIYPQEMTVVAGYNGTGKTTLALQFAHSAAANGIKPFIMSPEMPPKKTGSILARQATTVSEPTAAHWRDVYGYVRQNFILSVVEERLTPDSVIEDFDEAYALGCRFFVLDSLTCIRLNELTDQADFADRLRNWIRARSGCYLVVLAHMRKPPVGKSVRVTRYDIRGAGEITDLAAAVYLIARKDPFNPRDAEIYQDFDAMVVKDKCRETGKLGRTWLRFSDKLKLFHATPKAGQYMPQSGVTDIREVQ